MKQTRLHTAIVAAIRGANVATTHAFDADAKGRSVLALATPDPEVAELLIYGPIGDYFWGDGVTAAGVVAQLNAITANTINVRISSDGGVVKDGLAIYNALKRHPARIEVTIDGIAASIASLIAMAGDVVRMPDNSMMMLHAPSGGGFGNAVQLREVADVLDTFATAMTTSYVAKTNRADEISAMLTDGADHWFTAAEAVEFGLADALDASTADAAATSAATASAAALLSYITAIRTAPAAVRACLQSKIRHTTSTTAFASLREAHQRAVYAQLEDHTMIKQQCETILAQAGAGPAPASVASAAAATPATTPSTPVTPAEPVAPAAQAAPVAADPIAALTERNRRIRDVFAQFVDIGGVRELESACLADPAITVEAAQTKLLARVGGGAAPLNTPTARVEAGADEADRMREAGVNYLLARSGTVPSADAARMRQGNPFLHCTLIDMAERSLVRAGVNTRTMSRTDIAQRVLAQQTTSDFPVLLENTLGKLLVGAYNTTPFTWSRFCATGTLQDYRPTARYHLGSFSDLKPVNEAGEYVDGVLSDGAKESLQASRRGRILQITPEVLVNDDLGAFTRITVALGQAAGRTIEKDVYALFALNAGMGPTMADGKSLFHADHNNIAGTAAAPTVAAWDAARQQLGAQMDPGGNDYLDINPALWLGPLSLGTAARVVNTSEFNPDVSSKYAPPNTSRGMVRDVIDTPRITGKAWYLLADPAFEPVFEVGFLDGVQTPTIEQETNFRTDGLAWKVVHKYGVGAVGWRGAVRNAGA